MSNSYRNRTLRRSATPRRPANSALNASRRDVSIDWSKGPRDNLKTILSSITKRDDITIQQRICYLDFFTKFCSKMKEITVTSCGFNLEEIFCCLRVSLFHESADVRAAGLQAMRYLLKNELAVEAFYRTNLQLFVVRSLEIELNNFPERVQSLQLIRKLLALKPDALPQALCRSIIAIARDGYLGPDRDRMRDACMGCLGEITVLNPQVSCQSGGISALLDCILMSHESYHISESLIACILYILNSPELRSQLTVDVDLMQFIAPFTDCHYSMPLVALNTQRRDDEETREIRLNAAKIALVSVLRSWPGIFALSKVSHSTSFASMSATSFSSLNSSNNIHSNPNKDGGGSVNEVNGLASLIEMLNLPYKEIRKHIMELIFELFYLTVPKYTPDFQAALDSCSSSSVQDDWHLLTGFVASEGKSLLPHLAKKRLNLIDNYLSLLLYTFFTNGLLDGLVSVITVSSDAENSVRAIILVGELLHLSSQLLPPEIAQRYYTLPKLIETSLLPNNTPEQRNVAKAAITFLNHIHNRKKHHTIPYSLYLNQLIHFYNPSHRKFHYKRKKSATDVSSPLIPAVPVHSASIPAMVMASSSLSAASQSSLSFSASRKESKDHTNDDVILNVQIRESMVLKSDPNKWDWHLISSVLKSSCDTFKRLQDSSHRSFVKKIIHYFKPSSKLFSKDIFDDETGRNVCTVGCYLIDFLLEADESKTGEYIGDFLNDIGYCISQITGVDTSNSSSSTDAILHSHNLLRTWSHAYFLYVGRFTGSAKGLQYLEKAGICDTILKLVQSSPNENYLKLIVSSFNYSKEATFSRNVLSKVLSSDIESARFYAVKYLRVLLRLGSDDYRDLALELLSQRLCDESSSVVLAAIDILDEACDVPENLEALINLRPSLSHVGDQGLLLLIRYLSSPRGFRFLRDTNFLNNELERWKSYYSLKYVKIVEDLLNEAFSVHQRNESGTYGRRTDKKPTKKAVFVPAHLYGELVKQDDGYNLVVQENFLGPVCNVIKNGCMNDENSILQLKAALWTVGSVGASAAGFQLINEVQVIPAITKLASDAPVLSIRGTCFYVLGMLSSTEYGANALSDYGWLAVRHTRGERWPLSKEMIGANMEAGLFLYPLMGKREHTWSVSTASTRLTDICALVAGKMKSLDPANSFVFNEDLQNSLNYKNMEDILSHSFPSLEMSQLFHHKKSLSLRRNFFQNSSHDNGRHGEESRPGSSFDYHQRDCGTIASCTPDTGGIWINDDHLSELGESQRGNGYLIQGLLSSSPEGETSHFTESSHDLLGKSVGPVFPPNQNSSTYHPDTPDANSSHQNSSQDGSKFSAYIPSIPGDRYHRRISVTHAGQSRSLTESHAMACYYDSPNSHRENYFKRSTSHDINFSSNLHTSSRTFGNSSETSNLDSIPSAMDTLGYATLSSLQRNRIASINPRRHNVTDESLSFNEDTSDDDSFSLSFKGSRNFSESHNQDHEGDSSGDDTNDNITYMGICLPTTLATFFIDNKDLRYKQRQNSVHSKNQRNTATENVPKEPLNSSSRDEFSFEFHNSVNCLLCSFKSSESRQRTLSHCSRDSNSVDSSNPNVSEDNLLTVEKGQDDPKKHVGLLEPSFSSYVSSSPEIKSSSLPKESKLMDVSGMRKEIIRYVSYLLGWLEVIKMAEQGLLNLKQKYPLAFQDICLYSEISMQLASYNFRLPARRFLQELFMDLSFDSLYPDVESIYTKNSVYDIGPCEYSN